MFPPIFLRHLCSSDLDSADSVYSSALDPSSALPETVISNKDPLHSMDSERLATLEQALAELQAKDANTQHKLDILISHIPQSENLIPSTQITSVTPKAHGLKLALPSEFDGDCTKGMAFLNSCQVYICLCWNSFMDKQAKIVWAMSYMKAGWAAKWSAWVFQWEEQPENVGYHKFVDWEDFRDEFKREFCPVYADSVAINRLESTAYFQKSRSVDEYLDEFQDLIMEAGYSDLKTIVVKFRRGLDTQIQNAIATITAGTGWCFPWKTPFLDMFCDL